MVEKKLDEKKPVIRKAAPTHVKVKVLQPFCLDRFPGGVVPAGVVVELSMHEANSVSFAVEIEG